MSTSNDATSQTFRFITDVLQLLSCVALCATQLRLVEEYSLSKIFMVLPLLLAGVFLTRVLPSLRQDLQTTTMLTGAILGVNCGFVSSVVDGFPDRTSEHDVSRERKSGMALKPLVQLAPVHLKNHVSTTKLVLRQLELLHIPVVVCALAITFAYVFERPPSKRTARLAAKSALFAAVVGSLGSFLGEQELNIGRICGIFGIMFIGTFTAAMLTVLRDNQHPWVGLMVSFGLCLFWQCSHFDASQWDWDYMSYPIPGALSGLIIVFTLTMNQYTDMTDEDEGALDPETIELMLSKEKHPRPNQHQEHNSLRQSLLDNSKAALPAGAMVNTFFWLAVTYAIERLSLVFIKANQRRNQLSPTVYIQRNHSDVLLACLTLTTFLCVISKYFKTNIHLKTGIIVALLFLYLTFGLPLNCLENGLFFDIVFGMSFVFVSCYHSGIQTF